MAKQSESASVRRLGWVDLHILLALGQGDLHGYAIMQLVAEQSSGKVCLGPGTLYGAIKRLSAAGLIAESRRSRADTDDPRRRYYRILPAGRRAMSRELEHLAGIMRTAHAVGLI